MQINKLTVKVGTTINLGDYQSVKAEIEIGADLDPREDDGEAFNALRQKAMAHVINLLIDNHPRNHRLTLDGGKAAPAQLSAPSTPSNGTTAAAETAKRTRRTKEQIAADEAAKAAKARADAASVQLGEPAPDLEGLGGGDDDMAALLGDEVPNHPPVTAAEAKAEAGRVIKALGGPSLVKLLGEFGAASFPSLDAKHYGNFVARVKVLVPAA